MDPQDPLRRHLLDLLGAETAHPGFDRAVGGLHESFLGEKPPGSPHTPWRLVEHMRIAQWDILQFCTDPAHVSPDFPAGYWPSGDAPPDDLAWEQTLRQFQADLDTFRDLVSDPERDLYAPVRKGQHETWLREALLIADHNAYHIGQLIEVRRLLGCWSD